MSTNIQTDTYFIRSIQSDGPGVLISVAMLALVVTLVSCFSRNVEKYDQQTQTIGSTKPSEAISVRLWTPVPQGR